MISSAVMHAVGDGAELVPGRQAGGGEGGLPVGECFEFVCHGILLLDVAVGPGEQSARPGTGWVTAAHWRCRWCFGGGVLAVNVNGCLGGQLDLAVRGEGGQLLGPRRC